MPDYDAFRIRVERLASGSDVYEVHASSPAGEASGGFRVPVSRLELENLVLRMGRARTAVRGSGSPELQLVRRFGSDLFTSLFAGQVRDLYRDSYTGAQRSRKGLRITLGLTDTPELMDLPWEYLFEEPAFLSISTWTPVVRYLELPRSRPPIEVTPPLRILGMVSSPSDAVQLDVAQERSKLEGALAEATSRGAVEIRWLEQATLSALQRELRHADFHVFHYIGHGDYDTTVGDGVLLLEDEQGKGRRVSGTQLGTMLADETTLRLAVLNACEGARTSTTDPFAGVASSLVQREIPAVVAMQFEITDRAAIVFAEEFYAAIADGYAVDAALAEARKAIFANGNDTEWATPVLFMRVPDGRIFDVPAPAQAPPREIEPPLPPVPPPEPPETRGEEKAPAPTPEPSPTPVPGTPSLLWTALALGLGGLFIVGLLYPWDRVGRSWVDRHFHESAGGTGDVLSALSPLVLIVGTLAAVLLAHTSARWRPFAAGLLIGFGVAGAAKYGGLVLNQLSKDDVRPGSIAVLLLVTAGAGALAVLGSRLGLPPEEGPVSRRTRMVAVALAVAGALLVLVGCAVDYNGANSKSILADDGWFALDPLAGALVGLGAVFVGRGSGRVGAGILVAAGVVGLALWPRFIGVPIALDDQFGSAAPGGFIGLLGSLLLVAAGVALAWPRRAKPAEPLPEPA
jgi:hypothetical protein